MNKVPQILIIPLIKFVGDFDLQGLFVQGKTHINESSYKKKFPYGDIYIYIHPLSVTGIYAESNVEAMRYSETFIYKAIECDHRASLLHRF